MSSAVEVGNTETVIDDSEDFVQSHVDSFFYNEEGAVPYEKLDITDEMTELHLPKDILARLPIQMPKQSKLGSPRYQAHHTQQCAQKYQCHHSNRDQFLIS